jgi:hypothetical protein
MLTTFGGPDASDRFPSISLLPTPAAGQRLTLAWLCVCGCHGGGVLPMFSLWALSAAACAALLAIFPLRPRTYAGAAWDMAGAFTLLGCAAAILGEIEPIIETSARRGAGAK